MMFVILTLQHSAGKTADFPCLDWEKSPADFLGLGRDTLFSVLAADFESSCFPYSVMKKPFRYTTVESPTKIHHYIVYSPFIHIHLKIRTRVRRCLN